MKKVNQDLLNTFRKALKEAEDTDMIEKARTYLSRQWQDDDVSAEVAFLGVEVEFYRHVAGSAASLYKRFEDKRVSLGVANNKCDQLQREIDDLKKKLATALASVSGGEGLSRISTLLKVFTSSDKDKAKKAQESLCQALPELQTVLQAVGNLYAANSRIVELLDKIEEAEKQIKTYEETAKKGKTPDSSDRVRELEKDKADLLAKIKILERGSSSAPNQNQNGAAASAASSSGQTLSREERLKRAKQAYRT